MLHLVLVALSRTRSLPPLLPPSIASNTRVTWVPIGLVRVSAIGQDDFNTRFRPPCGDRDMRVHIWWADQGTEPGLEPTTATAPAADEVQARGC